MCTLPNYKGYVVVYRYRVQSRVILDAREHILLSPIFYVRSNVRTL